MYPAGTAWKKPPTKKTVLPFFAAVIFISGPYGLYINKKIRPP
jgi:hypothetical protein